MGIRIPKTNTRRDKRCQEYRQQQMDNNRIPRNSRLLLRAHILHKQDNLLLARIHLHLGLRLLTTIGHHLLTIIGRRLHIVIRLLITIGHHLVITIARRLHTETL